MVEKCLGNTLRVASGCHEASGGSEAVIAAGALGFCREVTKSSSLISHRYTVGLDAHTQFLVDVVLV